MWPILSRDPSLSVTGSSIWGLWINYGRVEYSKVRQMDLFFFEGLAKNSENGIVRLRGGG
jgi:hypothetical protein